MNPKIQKTLARLALGLAGSAAVGALIKLEKKADEKVVEHFDSKNTAE